MHPSTCLIFNLDTKNPDSLLLSSAMIEGHPNHLLISVFSTFNIDIKIVDVEENTFADFFFFLFCLKSTLHLDGNLGKNGIS